MNQQRENSKGRMWSLWVSLFWFGVAVFTLLAIVIRLTVQDSYWGASAYFYATPLPVVAVTSGLLFLKSARKRSYRWATFWVLCCVLLVGSWVAREWKFDAPRAVKEDAATVMFANLSRKQSCESFLEKVRLHQPDVIGLVEIGQHPEEETARWNRLLPDYQFSFLYKGLGLLSRKPQGRSFVHWLGHGSVGCEQSIEVDGRELTCIVVDMTANPLVMRRPILDELAYVAGTFKNRHVLIMGDFNTPAESHAFDALREQHQNLFDAAGHGYRGSWPLPFPVLALDQIWINQNLIPVECVYDSSEESDHRVVIGRFQFRERDEETGERVSSVLDSR
ncbi:endonuclease/exonuclease/phosphatase family protein [Thalassoglobus sp. JC818]|uniref:endonuclease/exonuclease/phosphatase family protein n=1 Tax=Thalassoglobus sp. JC818 TaxID=3232136 RepID=UPI003458BB48